MNKVRIGIDFGYQFTGLAILDNSNKVLDYAVIRHRNISSILLSRRGNRSARRRKKTQSVRLRNFYALLKGMGIEPRRIIKHLTEKEKKKNECNKKFIGNQLYALAHRRGWDYSNLVELLIDDKGASTATVRQIDKILVEDEEFSAPHTTKTITRKGEEYRIKEINTTCLGELAEYQKSIKKNQRIIDKSSSTDEERQNAIDEIQQQEIKYDKLLNYLENADLKGIKKYINDRIEEAGTKKNKQRALKHILVLLGLDIGKTLHEQGKLYTPHKNRHRNEFVNELIKKMKIAFKDPSVQEKAKQQTIKQKSTVNVIQKKWQDNAIAILDPNNPEWRYRNNGTRKKNNKDIRPARFENRHVGKCPAKLENSKRCNCNLPKKSKSEIRKLQFEIEARQMNIKDGDDERKLTDEELLKLIACVDFDTVELSDNGKNWDAFFKQHKTPRIKEDARGKKDILKDIATGTQAGRSGLCKVHLQEKLNLLKEDQTESKNWERLHQERILSIHRNDAPPSIRQKIEVVINTLKRMLKKQGYDLKNLPVEHIGIETARFDISALAQNEGRKFKKKKNYQKRSSRTIEDLKNEQDNKCLYCGNELGFATVEHIFAKARGGSNKALNRAVAHDICNINKGKDFVKIQDQVLEAIKRNNPKKYKFIQNGIKKDWDKVDTSLAGAQHTMFGAKLLKGSLIEALKLEQLSDKEIENIFPKVKAKETALLRKCWFPLMDKQKSVLRYKDKENIKSIKITIDNPSEKKKLIAIEWSKKLSDNITIQLEKPEKLKDWITYKIEDKKTTIEIDNKQIFSQGDERILSYKFNAIDKETGEIKQYKKLHIVIQPAENDGIHSFHHALDAIVSASSVDWNKLNLTANDSRINDRDYKRKFKEATDGIRPNIQLEQIQISTGEKQYIAPNKIMFLKEYKQDKSRPKCSKTNTQAIRWKHNHNKCTQRKPLYKIAKKNIKNIQGNKIKSLMSEAFNKIEKMSDNKKRIYLSKQDGNIFITQDYFLSLGPKHKLHPTNIRSVRCLTNDTENELFKRVDKNNNGEHFYKRTVLWAKAVVYEYLDKDNVVRLKEAFYINKDNHQTQLPEEARIIKEFKRGDKVKINRFPKRLWRIEKLGHSATLLAIDNIDDIKKTTSVYKNLTSYE